MQIQLSWVRGIEGGFPRDVKPLAKGTNTLVFVDPDPSKVIVFMLCGAKKDWWVQSGLATNPNEGHWFADKSGRGRNYLNEIDTYDLTLYRVQAKKLYKPANGSPQKKLIADTVRTMEAIYQIVRQDDPSPFTESPKRARRRWASEFWNRVYCDESLPEDVREMGSFCMNYYVLPDLAPRNAMVDADGEIYWNDLFVSEDVLDFLRMKRL